MMRRARLYLIGPFALATTLFVACTLNPQPLPPIFEPDDEQAAPGYGAADAGARPDDERPEPPDSGTMFDGGDDDAGDVDAGDDAGDAGDPGDAGSDAEID